MIGLLVDSFTQNLLVDSSSKSRLCPVFQPQEQDLGRGELVHGAVFPVQHLRMEGRRVGAVPGEVSAGPEQVSSLSATRH